jgi:antitoxin component HigA of HigAB toxin-antitoxin module
MRTTKRVGVSDSYLELIAEFPLRRIKTVAEHTKAKKLVSRLSAGGADPGAAEYFDVLIDLVADYEKRSEQVIDGSTLSAAELIRHRIEERGMSVSSLARLIGVPQSNLSDMLSGKRAWSKSAIRGLSAHLNIRAERFLTRNVETGGVTRAKHDSRS